MDNLTMFLVQPSKLDSRDHVYYQRRSGYRPEVDLREWDSLVEDQGLLGSCTAQAMTSAYELMVRYQYPGAYVELSELFVYYNTRIYYGEQAFDTGATLRDTLKSCRQYGLCRENLWPYDIEKFDDRPPYSAYQDAKDRTVTEYTALKNQPSILESIDDYHPVLIAMEVYKSFENLRGNSILPMPGENEQSLGGHAVVLVGYDTTKNLYLVKNSYGAGWGNAGYFWMPFEYYTQYGWEAWQFEISTQPSKQKDPEVLFG